MDLVELLPQKFSFYDQGEVILQNSLDSSLERSKPAGLQNRRGVGFRIYHLDNAPSAILIFLFDAAADESMYTEMGNILASKLCQSLTEKDKAEMMISPPIQLQSHQLLRLASQHTGTRRIYSHTYLQNGIEKSTDVETWTVPITTNLSSTHLGTTLGEQIGNV